MSLVDDAYDRAVDAMTVAERIQRMVELTAWSREVLAQRIQEELGPLTPEQLKWQLLLRLYGDSPQLRPLIEEAISNLSPQPSPGSSRYV
ncbi:MAG: hypothetical protein KF774_11380 [Planctomyces sp.]|nr:hypothetical protein [Planctomyces sp.]